MKFTRSWLEDHLETSASLDEIAEVLSSIGLEVDGIENPAERLGAFTIARVVEAKKHPNADKLQVLQVETEKGKPTKEVVCGAPNAHEGMLGVFAPIGTYVPGLDLTLVQKPVRGVVSNGMMCSAAELELSDDSEGIIEVDPEFVDRVGEAYVDVLGLNDPVIEVGLTPNRPDCTGVRGIARDLAAAGIGKFKPEPKIKGVEGKYECPVSIDLEFAKGKEDACPVFAGRYVKGVKNGPSPDWLQARLRAIGLRPINALVDITNYISFDRGRPLHVYDADKLKGGIVARLGEPGEEFLGLDGKTYQTDQDMCVIADDNGPLGFGGVMGGETTGCTEETTNVLIESAWFDPIRTAQTGRKTGLITDARYRFERGVDPQSTLPGLDLATQMIMELTGGKPSKKEVAGKPPNPKRVIEFDPTRVEKLTGVKLKDSAIKKILKALGCEITSTDSKKIKVSVPTWRPDIHGAADLVEEVVRIHGIDNVPSTPLPRLTGVSGAVLTTSQKRSRRARAALAGRGFVEAITWSFISQNEAKVFGGGREDLDLANPIASDLSSMRPSLLPGLISAAQHNRNRGFPDCALFELGNIYKGREPDEQILAVAGLRAGTAGLMGAGRHWDGAAKPVDVFDAKADAHALLNGLGLDPERTQTAPNAPEYFHPGRSGSIQLGPKNVLAHFGVLHPGVLRTLDVEGPMVAFEAFITALPPEKKKSRAKPPYSVSDLMPVRRDFAFIIDDHVAAGVVVKAARSAEKQLISNIIVFDTFEGGALKQEGKKSLGLEVTLQPLDATLTDNEIEDVAQRIVAAVEKATGGTIRT